MNKTFLIDVTSSIFWTFIVICIMCLLAACNNESDKPTEQTPGIYLDDELIKRIYIIKDTRNNRQWEAIGIGHTTLIIPGTEKPIK